MLPISKDQFETNWEKVNATQRIKQNKYPVVAALFLVISSDGYFCKICKKKKIKIKIQNIFLLSHLLTKYIKYNVHMDQI